MPPTHHSDPFSDPPAEPVVHDEVSLTETISTASGADAPSPEYSSDPYSSEPYASEPFLEEPSGAIASDLPIDTSVESPVEELSSGDQPTEDHREDEPSITSAI